MKRTKGLYLALLAVSMIPMPLYAGAISAFSDLGSFQTAVGATEYEDFGSGYWLAIPGGVLNNSVRASITPGVTYSAPVGPGFYFNLDAGGGFNGTFLDSRSDTNDPANVLTVDFDGAVSAFAFTANGLMGESFNLVINFLTGPSYSINRGLPTASSYQVPRFYGFQSDMTDITSIIVDGVNGRYAFNMDDFRFTTPVPIDTGPEPEPEPEPVPEPGTLALLGLGLAGIGVSRRRTR